MSTHWASLARAGLLGLGCGLWMPQVPSTLWARGGVRGRAVALGALKTSDSAWGLFGRLGCHVPGPAAAASPAQWPSSVVFGNLQSSHSHTPSMAALANGSERVWRSGPPMPPARPCMAHSHARAQPARPASARAVCLHALKHLPTVGVLGGACACTRSGTRSRRFAPPPGLRLHGPGCQLQAMFSPLQPSLPKTRPDTHL